MIYVVAIIERFINNKLYTLFETNTESFFSVTEDYLKKLIIPQSVEFMGVGYLMEIVN